MNKRRLLKLAALLEKDAENKKGIKFDLHTWAKPSEGDFNTKPKSDPAVDCGTTACAFGLAAISGAFKRQGLTYTFRRNDFWGRFDLLPKFNGSIGFRAAGKFFGISTSEAEFLFLPSEYPGITTGKRGELKVARRIRKFVAGEVKP